MQAGLTAASGDLGDVGELYAALAARLEHIVGRGVSAPRSVVEDACQSAWGRLWRHRANVRRETALSWLASTAIHEALRLVRGLDRDLSLEQAIEDRGEGVVLAGAAAPDVCEARTRLAVIGSLSERQQRLLWLHGIGFNYAEIAARTGSTTRTVERQILRGKRTLREMEGE